MATPKQATLIKVHSSAIDVWTDEPEKELAQIRKIRGVTRVMMIAGNPIFVQTDPRYDVEEIADEISELLKSEVPEVLNE